jgi:nucleoside-diphosphate-sugar epimerase
VLKRIDDGRRQIIFAEDVAAPRGYVEDVGAAVALAATSSRFTNRIYNVCETESFSELDWARKIAAAVGWSGEFITLPHDCTPKHLIWPANTAQHLIVSSERIRRELGYCELLSREEAFRRTIAWERAHCPLIPMYQFNYREEDAVLVQARAAAESNACFSNCTFQMG